MDQLEADFDELLFAVRRSVRYHRHRERFFDRVHHLGVFVTAFLGSATVVTLLVQLPPGSPWLPLLAGSLTVLASVAELVFGPARAARRHESLVVGFLCLEKDCLRAALSLTPESLVELQSRRLDIEAAEPPVYRVLDAVCHDELVTALGRDPDQRTNVTRWQRLWRHFFDVGAHKLEKTVDIRARAR
ncbi:MAG: hypothetical protein F4137_09420 [Acidobacteria bacterium]|nr:hypothetical protein [Acidobacteriota bacterium]